MPATLVQKTYQLNQTLDSGATATGSFTIEFTYADKTGLSSIAPTSAILKTANIITDGNGNTALSERFTFGVPDSTVTGGLIKNERADFDTAPTVSLNSFSPRGTDATGLNFGLSTGVGSDTHKLFTINFQDNQLTGNVSGSGARAVYSPAEILNSGPGSDADIASYKITASSIRSYELNQNNLWAAGENQTTNDTIDDKDYIVWYAKGALITTQSGEVAIEALREGDLVLTVSGEYAPLQWLGYRTVNCANNSKPNEAYPVRIVTGAFGDNLPKRDLLLSPFHSVYVNGIFIPACDLLNDVSVYQDQSNSKVTYYHLELSTHNAIYAEGMPSETYLDDNNRGFFLSNSEDGKHATSLVTDVPKLASKQIRENKGFAKVVRQGPELEAVRELLAKRLALFVNQVVQVAA